ncbi:unnamed protein product [Leptidea sinapis]|uniref:Uncharacterized protein n=1 Tax=Leptidea sinapis TaxID=189913 RepID=A0A5E4QXA6_9NEOP|nr:unnamed protein product [Leptidea sinapis]
MADIVLRHSEDDDDTQGVILAKGVSMAVLFCASMVCGMIPLVLAKRLRWIKADDASNLKSTNKVVVSLLSFGGGVLLSTTFLHLLPEVDHNIEDLQAAGRMREFDFSLAPFLMCCGFFLMYLVEELVHVYIRHREKKSGSTAQLVRNLSVRRSRANCEDKVAGDKRR